MKNLFSRTTAVYENVSNVPLRVHQLDCPPAADLIRASSKLFQALDHTDPVQQELSRLLWRLRSSVLFTVLPFDDSALKLCPQVVELQRLSVMLPDATGLVDLIV